MSINAAKTFRDLVETNVEPNSTVYASPEIWSERVEYLADLQNTEAVIVSEVEFLESELYESENDIETVESLENYLEQDREKFDAEFLALGTLNGDLDTSTIESLLAGSAHQSDKALKGTSFTFYSDNAWTDPRIDPLYNTSMNLKDIHKATKDELSKYFDSTETIDGGDYGGVIAIR